MDEAISRDRRRDHDDGGPPVEAGDRHLGSKAAYQTLRHAIERRLETLAPTCPTGDSLRHAVRYALLSPGKRLRPALTMLAVSELGGRHADALDAGCALEMIHAASLVLDDLPLMDDSPLRRGQPSTHVRFGQDTAVLASVTLLSQAYATVAGAAHLDADTRCELVAILTRAVGADGLARGQFDDLRTALAGEEPGGIADANHLKTGMLFVAAVEMASVIAGADRAATERLRVFATHLGQAFQILDDLTDAGEEGGPEHDRSTLVSTLGREAARSRLDGHVSAALGQLAAEGPLARLVGQTFRMRQRS